MKNVFLTLALCVSLSGFAQIFNVGTIEKVNVERAKAAAISPQGDYLLLTSSDNQGLAKYDLSTGATKTLSNAQGAGYDVKVSRDGQMVVYRENSYTATHLKNVSLKSANLITGENALLVAPTRNLQGVGIEGKSVVAVNKGMATTKVATPVLSIQNRQLVMTLNGKTKVFSPNGKNTSYLWPSVSPDGTKVLYYVAGNGAYVCDLKGHHRVKVGTMRAPQWYDNNTVIGMNDQDDGEFIYASSIVAATLNGETQTLTDATLVAMYPKAASGKIAFSTPAGDVYIINVTK